MTILPANPKPFRVLNATGTYIPGTLSVIFVDQNVDPGSKSGTINTDKIINHIIDKHGDAPHGYGMLDFEVPYDHWIGEGFGSPNHKRASEELRRLLYTVSDTFPNVIWTLYGIPGLSYWPGDRLWISATEKDRYAEKCRQIANYMRVMSLCDWYAPCLYDIQRNSELKSVHAFILNDANERDYRHSRIDVCKMANTMSGTRTPIIPVLCPLYCNGGNVASDELRLIPESEWLSDQVQPCVDNADGCAIWLAPTWMVNRACSDTDGTAEQAKIREMFLRDFLFGITPSAWDDPSTRKNITDCITATFARYAKIAATAKPTKTTTKGANDAK